MALKKNFLDARGITLPDSYWRVSKIEIDIVQGKAAITLLGWRDQTAREQNLAPVGGVKIEVAGAEFATEYAKEIAKQSNLAEISYALALTHPAFAGAESV